MRKRIIWAVVLCLLAGLFALFWRWLSEDDMRPPKLPIASAPGQLTLTSNGCCFFVDDVAVTVGDIVVAAQDKLYEHGIHHYALPDNLPAPSNLHVEFDCYYGGDVPFSMDVLEIVDAQAIKESGILLYFQEKDDMYLNVVAGDDHASYKMNASGERWRRTDVPNTIYP